MTGNCSLLLSKENVMTLKEFEFLIQNLAILQERLDKQLARIEERLNVLEENLGYCMNTVDELDRIANCNRNEKEEGND